MLEPIISTSFQNFAEELEVMAIRDQKMRHNPDLWQDTVDQENTARMKEIVAEIGWPTRSKVGPGASQNAWLLVQHADHDPAFQARCLALMKAEPANEVSLSNLAYLEDRVRVNTGRPQLYGTQFTRINGVVDPQGSIADIKHVNERRKVMELGTLEENLAMMQQKFVDHDTMVKDTAARQPSRKKTKKPIV